ncbi:hypothetical protein [Ornithinimicrobium kibberense]|uniref:hypothetical protein n=1 Tax=Ornithinimicrobium kibberense TaxID=282060 RepID=UPI0036092F96
MTTTSSCRSNHALRVSASMTVVVWSVVVVTKILPWVRGRCPGSGCSGWSRAGPGRELVPAGSARRGEVLRGQPATVARRACSSSQPW